MIQKVGELSKSLNAVSLERVRVLVCLDLEDYCTDGNPLQEMLNALEKVARGGQESAEAPWLLLTTS